MLLLGFCLIQNSIGALIFFGVVNMPYIKPTDRLSYDDIIKSLAEKVLAYRETGNNPAGQLNYIITRLLLEVYGQGLDRYSNHNEIIGILECAKLEVYRIHTSPYEDIKSIENGPVQFSGKRL